jgi:hypothetical protein
MTMRLFILHDHPGAIVASMKAHSRAEDVDQPYGGLQESEKGVEVVPVVVLEVGAPHEIMDQYAVRIHNDILKKE